MPLPILPPLVSRMRQRVILQQPSDTPDTAGGVTRSWTDVAPLWAEITPLLGREAFVNLQLTGTVTHRVRMRYRSGVTPAMRLAYGSRYFNIRAVLNVSERGQALELLCEEGAGT